MEIHRKISNVKGEGLSFCISDGIKESNNLKQTSTSAFQYLSIWVGLEYSGEIMILCDGMDK